jgi:hypothetical protein
MRFELFTSWMQCHPACLNRPSAWMLGPFADRCPILTLLNTALQSVQYATGPLASCAAPTNAFGSAHAALGVGDVFLVHFSFDGLSSVVGHQLCDCLPCRHTCPMCCIGGAIYEASTQTRSTVPIAGRTKPPNLRDIFDGTDNSQILFTVDARGAISSAYGIVVLGP